MHTEGEIRKAVKLLVEKFGLLTTSEIKERMSEVMTFDKEDLEKSKTRHGEIKILQRIGNIASHQTKKLQIYHEGFLVEKDVLQPTGKKQAVFSAITGYSNSIKKITSKEIAKKKNLCIKNKSTSYKKLDWNSLNERRSEVGLKGERFVYEREKEKAEKIFPGLSGREQHLSEAQGDWLGYDILSVEQNGESVYIEVKTTIYGIDTPFYMSVNEYDFFKQRQNDSSTFLYRVYDFDTASEHGLIKVISAKELISEYKFDPISYIVSKKILMIANEELP